MTDPKRAAAEVLNSRPRASGRDKKVTTEFVTVQRSLVTQQKQKTLRHDDFTNITVLNLLWKYKELYI